MLERDRTQRVSPFPGIRPYSEKEAEDFYGREREVEDVLGILKRFKLVTICGESGSGKSSLIQAGILPKLKKGFLGQAGKEWVICNFRPGISPLENFPADVASNSQASLEPS